MIHKIHNKALILAGVRKCGTTTLFDMLARHHDISPASVKESQYFACSPDVVETNLEWYLDLFSDQPDGMLLDGSTWYFGARHAPELIKRLIPESRIILCLRDPAQRTYSGYLHMKKQTPSNERRPYDTILTGMERLVSSNHNIYASEDSLINKAVEEGLSNADYINPSFHKDRFGADFESILDDGRFSFRYFSESCYSKWLPAWEQVFSNRLLIIYFEELMRHPEEVIRRILDFAGLPYQLNVSELLKSNETRIPKNAFAEGLLAFRKNYMVGRTLANLIKKAGLLSAGAHIQKNYLYGKKESATQEQLDRTQALLHEEYNYWSERDRNITSFWSNS